MAAKPKAVVVVTILAIIIAVVASVALYNYLQTQEERVKEAMKKAVATEPVVVAAKEIPIGSHIDPSQVKTSEWPRENVPPDVFPSVEQAVGRVAIQTMAPGEPITGKKLVPLEGPPGVLTYKIPEGHRAMTVGVDQVSGVAGFISPGNRIDVVLTTQKPGTREEVSRIVLQDIPVLATGQIVEQKEGKPVVVPTVTLDVTPDEAEKLALSSSQGRLQLLLRRTGDVSPTLTSGATITRVMREAGMGRPKMAPAELEKVAVAKEPATAMRKPKPAGMWAKGGPKKTYAPPAEAARTRMGGKMTDFPVDVWRDSKKTVETFRVKEEAK